MYVKGKKITTKNNLFCQFVLHANVPYKVHVNNSIEALKVVIHEIINQCELLKLKEVCLPAIGTSDIVGHSI